MFKTYRSELTIVAILTSSVGLSSVQAALIDYSTSGATYSQNFDSLGATGGTWDDGVTLTGWHHKTQHLGIPTAFVASDGSSTQQGKVISMGDDSDRAFGAQSLTNALTQYYGFALENNTGATQSSFNLSYTAEQWRVQDNNADPVVLEYQVFNAGDGLLQTTGWTSVSELGFTAPITTGASAALDGNLSVNQVSVVGSVTSIEWEDGQELWLRWSDSNIAYIDGTQQMRQMMGVDDLSFSAVPEPGTFALLFGAGVGAFVFLRRRTAKL